MFEILAKAGAGALYKLLSKLPVEEAAIVLTHLPNNLAIQVIAYYPGETQAEIGPAMVDARWAEPEKIEFTEAKIRTMLSQAKQSLAAKNSTGVLPKQPEAKAAPKLEANDGEIVNAPPPSPPTLAGSPPRRPVERGLVERKHPGAPVARPASNQFGNAGNPYQPAGATPGATAQNPPASQAKPQAKPGALANTPVDADTPDAKPTLTERAKELAKSMLRPPVSAKRKNEPPKPWVPRQATASPINGPALPGTPPPVAGDPFTSPLAKAGLLDLIGRAQEKLLPKNAPQSKNAPQKNQNAPQPLRLRTISQSPVNPGKQTPGKPGQTSGTLRPEPLEGLLAPDSVQLVKTPRLIGPGAPKKSLTGNTNSTAKPPLAKGARRMDGKAILAAILREAGAEVRGAVRHDDPALFSQLRERMFYFDDLVLTEDNALARVFTAAPTEESALALKFAAPALREKVLRAVSPGRARALREHAAARAGLDEVEKAQQTVLGVALQLQSAGRILIDPRDPDLAGK